MTSSLTSPAVCKVLVAKNKFKDVLCSFCRTDKKSCDIYKNWEKQCATTASNIIAR